MARRKSDIGRRSRSAKRRKECTSKKKKCSDKTVKADYLCKICHLSFTSEQDLQQHSDYYKDPRFACEVCETKFADEKQLQRHSFNAHGRHTIKFNVECKVCTQVFAWPVVLRAHLFHYHENYDPSIEIENNLADCQTKSDSQETEYPRLIENSPNCEEKSLMDKNSECAETTRQEERDVRSNEKRSEASEVDEENVATRRKRQRDEDDEDKGDERSRKNPNTMFAKKNGTLLPSVRITRIDINKLVSPRIQCSSITEREIPVSNETVAVPEKKNVGTRTNREHNLDNVASPDGRSSENTIAAPSLQQTQQINYPTKDSPPNLSKNDAEKSNESARDCELEIKLRRSFDCRDCTVPLIRLKAPGICAESTKTNLSRALVTEAQTVIASIICDKIFVSEATMIDHYQLHHFKHSNGDVFCVCGKKMDGSDALQFHFYRYCQKSVVATAQPSDPSDPCRPLEKTRACPKCGEKFWLESCLRSHVYDCKSFIIQKVKKIPINSGPPAISKLKCRVCFTQFRSLRTLRMHRKKYSYVPTFRCNYCATMFPSHNQLVFHTQVTHLLNTRPDYNHVCTKCSQPFKDKNSERIHRLHIHRDSAGSHDDCELAPNDSNFDGCENSETLIIKCKVCNLVFSSKKRFIEHTTYYAKDEIIRCKTCYKHFEGQYKAHHHNKKTHYSADMRSAFTHRCNVCKEAFMFMVHLQAHVFHVHLIGNIIAAVDQNGSDGPVTDTRQNDSPHADSWMHQLRDRDGDTRPPSGYACNVCDVRFPSPNTLAEHQYEFSEDNGYISCNRCSKRCPDQATLLNHLKLMHYGKPLRRFVKCARCNQQLPSTIAWISHAKHFHKVNEPSEFYFEQNIVFPLIGIPTNDSISSGTAYSRIESLMSNATNNVETPDPSVHGTEGFHETEENQKSVDVNTISAPLSNEKRSSTNINAQSVETNIVAQSQSETNDAMTKEATGIHRDICGVAKTLAGKEWNCGTCGYGFDGPHLLSKHVAYYVDSGPYMCEFCGRRFKETKFYVGHKIGHTYPENREFSCAICMEAFDTDRDMKMHIAHIHFGPLEVLPPESNDSSDGGKLLHKSLDQSLPKRVEAAGWPSPLIEISEKEESVDDENLARPESGSSVTQLAEQVTNVHGPNHNAKNLAKEPADVHACNICDVIFTNVKSLNIHKKRRHFIKLVDLAEKKIPNNVGTKRLASAVAPHVELPTAPTVRKETQTQVRQISRAVNDVPLVPQTPNGTPAKLRRPKITQRSLPTPEAGPQNLPNIKHHKSLTPLGEPDDARGTPVQLVHKSIVKSSIPRNAAARLTASSVTFIESIGTAEVLSDVDATRTLNPILHCQYSCSLCNIIFMNKNQLTAHEQQAHPSSDPADELVASSTTAAIFTKSPIDDLNQLVSTLPSEPSSMANIDAPLDFESVLIPVSAHDLERFEDESQNDTDVNGQIDPLEDPVEHNLPSKNRRIARLKVLPFDKVIEKLSNENTVKKRQRCRLHLSARKREMGVFDPEIFEKLCREHNLIDIPEPHKTRRQ